MSATINQIHCYVICPFCEKQQDLIVRYEGFQSWKAGELISRALPELTNDQRELLMTGICSDCFPKDPDE